MKAILYAAGRGLRLGPRYAGSPKILLRFGGRSLLEWHARRLAAIRVRDVAVVTGFGREGVLAEIERIERHHGLRIREIFNPFFSEGSVLSLHASLGELEGVEGHVLLMDGDVLYPTRLLERLLQSPHRTALLIDREYSTADDDPVLVPIVDGRPVEFRKRWTGAAEAVGESVGFFKVDREELPLVVEETVRRVHGAGRQEPYEEVLRAMVLAGRFQYEDITGLPWTEIDFPADVDHAARVVFPEIERYEVRERLAGAAGLEAGRADPPA